MAGKRNHVASSGSDIDTFLEYGVDVGSRTLCLSGEVDELMLDTTIRGLHLCASRGDEEITIHLTTEGGDIELGLAIYDSIRAVRPPVRIRASGRVYSMGAIILQAGTTREMTENSSLMIHYGYSGDYSSLTPKLLRKWEELSDKHYSKFVDILHGQVVRKNPEIRRNRIHKLLETDTIFTAEGALEFGLVDRITTVYEE